MIGGQRIFSLVSIVRWSYTDFVLNELFAYDIEHSGSHVFWHMILVVPLFIRAHAANSVVCGVEDGGGTRRGKEGRKGGNKGKLCGAGKVGRRTH